MNLDIAIKKSLYDKEIASFAKNPNIIINENSKNIKDKIKELLNKSSRVDIAISYVVWSGLSLIYDDLAKFGSDSRIILTTEGLVTDPRSLKKLNELDMQVKIYVPYSDAKGFHLKTYLFESEENRTLLIGSSNISARAFGMAHEMAVEIDAKSKGYIVEKYNNVFEDLWNSEYTEDLTIDFVSWYTDLYKEKEKIDNDMSIRYLDSQGIKPNYMQEKALINLEECRETHDKGLVIAATGTGKTYLSAFDVKQFGAKRVLFLVHNRLILTSAIKTYQNIFRNSKMIQLDSYNLEELYTSDFVFTTDKTAYNHLINKVPGDYFDYIIYDEAHRVGLDTLYKKIMNYFTPEFTLGITATPERTNDSNELFETFEYSVPYEIRLLDAMNHELVCPFTYYGFDLEERLLGINEQFNYEELSKYIGVLIKDKGHHGLKLKCLIFCNNIKEATDLSNSLNKFGFKSVSAVSGDKGSTPEKIEKYIEELRSNVIGTLEVICTVNKFNEGIDIPDINTIIMLRNTTSSIIYLQQLGRGLRRTSDPHKYVTVFDIIGNSKNNYSIAQVLTGNTTVDKRKLYMHAESNFEMVSPFINVDIQKEAMEKIIKSISNNFKVSNKLKEKFKNELSRFNEIPTLLDLYLNENFKELELLQLLYKNFYDPFEEYYIEKYKILNLNKFVSSFFTLISQFVFRAYSREMLKDYVKLLKGEKITNQKLSRILLPKHFDDGIPSAINSEYNKKTYNYIEPFKYKNKELYINEEVLSLLEDNNAIDLFHEHIELFEHLSNSNEYEMQTFDLIGKNEFLYNIGSNDCYMNVVGERIDHDKKEVYCTIKITKKESFYDNYIINNDTIVYYTQNSSTEESAIKKVENFVENKYKFYICAQFPHLGYSNTAYFNMGNVKLESISELKISKDGKFNHEIKFKLEEELPLEFLHYKE